MTLALPTIWGSCSATAFLLIDAQAYTAPRANQLSSRQHRAYLQPNKCDSGLKTTYLRFPGETAKLRRDSPLPPHPFLPPYRHRIDCISFHPPAVHPPVVVLLLLATKEYGMSIGLLPLATYHLVLSNCSRLADGIILNLIPRRRPSCTRPVIAFRTIQLPCPALPCHSSLHQAAAGLQETSHRFSHTPPAYRSVHISSRIGSPSPHPPTHLDTTAIRHCLFCFSFPCMI